MRFVRERHADPFFLYMPFNAPHYPMHAPARYRERFAKLDPERRTYAAMIAAMDDAVGQVMATLRELRLLDNTLVFFSADNGATRETRAGLESEARDRREQRAVSRQQVQRLRWRHARADGHELAGRDSRRDKCARRSATTSICCRPSARPPARLFPPDRTLDGVDAMPMAATGAKSPHDAIYWSSSGQTAVRRGPWKLVRNGRIYDGTPEGAKPLAGDDALFLSNLEEDPGESRNLRHAHANVADELQTMAEQWLKTVKEP